MYHARYMFFSPIFSSLHPSFSLGMHDGNTKRSVSQSTLGLRSGLNDRAIYKKRVYREISNPSD